MHIEVLKDFGFDVNETTIRKSKHVFANIPRILNYYLPSGVSESIVTDFNNMIFFQTVRYEKRFENIVRFIAGFLTEERTKLFIYDELKPYNDISEWDLVFISEIVDRHLHDYYKK